MASESSDSLASMLIARDDSRRARQNCERAPKKNSIDLLHS
jgi:hypothetical protein